MWKCVCACVRACLHQGSDVSIRDAPPAQMEEADKEFGAFSSSWF